MKHPHNLSVSEPPGGGRRFRPFLQPLVVAVVAFLLVGLTLFSGIMDLRTLDKTLTNYMEQRGLDMVENIRQGAGHYVHLLQHRPPPLLDDFALPNYDQPSFPLQESMIIHLMDLMRHMDLELAEGRLSGARLKETASREGIWFVGFFNQTGDPVLANRPVPESVHQEAAPVLRGEKRILIHVFGPPEPREIAGWLALRREWGRGSMVLALKQTDVHLWRLKTAVQKALQDVGIGEQVSYVLVSDGKGRPLASTGQAPEGWEDAIRQGRDPMSLRMDGPRKVLLNGEKLLEISAPVQFDEGVSGMIRVALSRERAEALLEREQKRGMVLMSFLGIIALLSMWLLYKNQNRHLRKMSAIEERLHQAQRLSALGRMAAGVAHEIRNPLNAISMACQRLNPDNIHLLSGVIREEVRRLDHIVEEFLSLSRHGRLAFRVQDIKPLIEHIVRLMDEESRSRGVQMVCEWREGPLPVPMDVDKMTQALLNIIKNAVEAVSDGGRVTLRVKEVGKAWARIEISDTGTGLTPEARKQMFDPGYTTKEKGLGLGLALAHEIIQGHGGQIRVMSEPDAGTTVEIRLPLKR